MEAVHAAGTFGIEKSDSRGRSNRETVFVRRHVGHMVCDQAIGSPQDLLGLTAWAKPHKTVGRSHLDGLPISVRINPVHTKNVVILDVQGAPSSARQDV